MPPDDLDDGPWPMPVYTPDLEEWRCLVCGPVQLEVQPGDRAPLCGCGEVLHARGCTCAGCRFVRKVDMQHQEVTRGD